MSDVTDRPATASGVARLKAHFDRIAAKNRDDMAGVAQQRDELLAVKARLHVLLAEALRCLDDGRMDRVRAKLVYADFLLQEGK